MFFEAMVNGIVLFISSSSSSLLVYRNATHFQFCILHPYVNFVSGTSLNLFISSTVFFVVFRVFHVQDHIIFKQRHFFSFLCDLDVLFIFLLVWLLWLELPVQCWIWVVRVAWCLDPSGMALLLEPLVMGMGPESVSEDLDLRPTGAN